MTNPWNDIANSDCVLCIGSNAAENHPAAFGHITVAQQRGGKLIVVDPRFTRSAAKADIYAPIRSGTDVAFIGGMIRYALEDMERNPNNYNMTYLVEYTNASLLINPDFKGPAELDGLFSGYDPAKRSYNTATWTYQNDDKGIPKRDKTLKDPNCVFQLMKKQYNRYTPETVSKVTGCPVDKFLEVCKTYAATGATGKAGVIIYAMGTTQHTNGSQNVRVYAVLQLLLANIGVAGGGIDAARGESNVQGSTDHGLLYHMLPGYLKMISNKDATLQDFLKRITPASKDPTSANWWQNTPKYVVSLLKAWYGDAATKENEFCYQYLPKNDSASNYSWIALFNAMYEGKIKGLLLWGQNPAVSGPNSNVERVALDKLDWMAVVDLWETETTNFWKRPDVDPANIKTEVFLLPACGSFEKEGSITNSGRWMQWRYKCAEPPGVAKPDLDIANDLMVRVRKLYQEDTKAPNRDAIIKLNWNYGEHISPHQVAKEVNGYDLTTGKLMTTFANLKDDGTTTSAEWVYCGSYTDAGNMSARRDLDDSPFNIELYSKWAWSWPVNRRIVYNRASVDLNGEPWDKVHPVVKWDAGKKAWAGDVIDGGGPPMAVDPATTRYPFIMNVEGFGRLFGGLVDGPFPEHYEPWESPVKNLLSNTEIDPVIKIWDGDFNKKGTPDQYPIVCTTYRVVEHWLGGTMTRNNPWNCELMPEMFIEISEELAAEKDIKNGERAIVESARGSLEALVLVTMRFKPFLINGKKIHEIGMPMHWGYVGLSVGASANILTPHVGDANTMIPEYKAFLCNIKKA